MKASSVFHFTNGLLALGALLAVLVAVDLGARGLHRDAAPPVWTLEDTNPDRGREAIVRHGCGACHVIPGVRSANGRVGPQLKDLIHQTYIAGVLPNTPENLVRWIQHPRLVNPPTAMPDLGLSEQEAADIAAYLYSTR